MKPLLSQFQAALVLNALPGIGPVACRRLCDAFGDDIAAALASDSKTLCAVPGIGKTLGEKISSWEKSFDLAAEEKKLARTGTVFLPFFDANYPALLKKIPDAPIGLYVSGNVEAMKTPRNVAIVGTRKASLYGSTLARKIAGALASARWTVVSGLARGIDTAAHIGTLEAGGATVAVLGNGADIVYPAENVELYKKIRDCGGAIVSEFPLGRVADKRTFPQRNRIIAGLCAGMLVVESDEKGGSMLSANFAAECGRTVFALPGRVDQINSRGCHKLIREGATLVTCADEIIEELEGVSSQPILPLDFASDAGANAAEDAQLARVREILASLPPAAGEIYEILKDGDAFSPDEIATKTALSASAVSSNLLMLELERFVSR